MVGVGVEVSRDVDSVFMWCREEGVGEAFAAVVEVDVVVVAGGGDGLESAVGCFERGQLVICGFV